MSETTHTGISRRAFSAALAAAAGGAFLAPGPLLRAARAQGQEALAIRVVAPGVSVITGRGGNSLVAAGDGGSVLIDSKLPDTGPALRVMAENAFIYDYWNHFSELRPYELGPNYFAVGNTGERPS